MKKTLTIILLAISLITYSQQTLRKGFISIQNNDTTWLTYNSGVWTLESDTTFIVKDVDTLFFADGTYQATRGVGSVDSLYHSDTETWLNSGDTIPKADSTRDVFIANDSIGIGGSYLKDIPQNDIFLWDSTNSNYEPYASFEANSWYYGTTNPSGTTRLNYDGGLWVYNFESMTNVYANNNLRVNNLAEITKIDVNTLGGSSVGLNSYRLNIENIDGLVRFYQTGAIVGNDLADKLVGISSDVSGTGVENLTGAIISITDNPTNILSNSREVLSATIDGTERIKLNPRSNRHESAYTIDTDSLMTTGAILDVKNQGTSILQVTNDSISAYTLDASFNSSINNSFFKSGNSTDYSRLLPTSVEIVAALSTKMALTPLVTDGVSSTAYFLNTSNSITLGTLLDISNNGTSKLKVTNDSILAESLVLKALKAIIDTISIGDSEPIDTIFQLKYAIENESFDSIDIGQVIRFNESEGVHEFLTGDNQVVWQGALEDLVQVYNNTGSIVANGTPFYLSQALGDTIIAIGIASANIPQGKALAGLITGEIGINEWGFGCVRGKVRGINTSSLSLSGVTWLSNDSSYTSTAPAYPSEKIIIGGAISIHATEGIIYVQPSLGFQRQLKTKSYSFTSSGIASGTFWDAGFYDYDVGDATLDEVSSDLDYGTANIAYEAHPFVVYGGAGSVTGGGRVALITTGTSIDGTGTQTALDVDTLINDITNAVLNAYNETKKYLGTFYYELVVVEGTPSAYSLDFNYGYAKYDDIGDRDFYITGLECTWRGAQTDATGFDIELLFHRTTGWTYNAEAFVAGDGTIAKRSTDQAGFLGVLDGQQAAWKRTDLNTFISGSANEGFIWKINTGANGTIQIMNMHIEIALD